MTRTIKFFIISYTCLLIALILGLMGQERDDFKFPVDMEIKCQ
jgi:hypothetical protein